MKPQSILALLLLPLTVAIAGNGDGNFRIACKCSPSDVVHRAAKLLTSMGYEITAAYPELGSISGYRLTIVEAQDWRISTTVHVLASGDTTIVNGFMIRSLGPGKADIYNQLNQSDLQSLIDGLQPNLISPSKH